MMAARRNKPLLKFGAFAVVMVVLSALLFLVFSQYRSGSTTSYSAVFADSSGLKKGDTVRVAGIRVGTVHKVDLHADKRVLVTFDADRSVLLTDGTTAAVRYLNLTGDRYLELVDGPGSTKPLASGAQIPVEHTKPALDLDLLLGGFKPLIQALNPEQVNALTASLVQILQGQEGTAGSLVSETSSFANTLAANSRTVQEVIDNLKSVMAMLSANGDQLSGAVDRLARLIDQLAQDRDPIGAAIQSLDNGTASVADLLTKARPPLAGTVDQLNRLAPNIDDDQLDKTLQTAPNNFRKMARTGAYGSFTQYYICAISVRVSDPSGGVIVLPWIRNDAGRCSP